MSSVEAGGGIAVLDRPVEAPVTVGESVETVTVPETTVAGNGIYSETRERITARHEKPQQPGSDSTNGFANSFQSAK